MEESCDSCIFLLAFTALKNDCSFLWPPEPELEEVTFKESLFTPSSGRGPLRELGEAAPRLGADPGACIQTRQFGKNSRQGGAVFGKGSCGAGVRALAQERAVRVTFQLGAPCLLLEHPAKWVCGDQSFHTSYIPETLS